MRVRDVVTVVVAAGCSLATSSTFGHDKPPGPFDGKWVRETVKCFPANNTFRFNNLAITNSRFIWKTTQNGREEQCKVAVKNEGSFQTDTDCRFQLKGLFEGGKWKISEKTSERICEIVAKHE